MSLKDTALSRLVDYRRARMKHTAALSKWRIAEGPEEKAAANAALEAAEKAREAAHSALLQIAERYDKAVNPP